MDNIISKYKTLSRGYKWLIALGVIFVLSSVFSGNNPSVSQERILNTAGVKNLNNEVESISISKEQKPDGIAVSTNSTTNLYDVVKVVDGDTLDVRINGTVERLRLIGINTPETVDPRKPVECFGIEASNKAKTVLAGKKVSLEADSSQDERDKYGRLLRYVFLEDGTNFNLMMVRDGFAYEYTYETPYKYQKEFKSAQKDAQTQKLGLWGNLCNSGSSITQPPVSVAPVVPTNTGSTECTIKGNINSKGEKIFHVIGCGSYNQTKIDESQGERWFCSEEEALSAGWRKALNCR